MPAWPDDRVRRLAALIDAGATSTVAGEALGVSRSAVIAAARRRWGKYGVPRGKSAPTNSAGPTVTNKSAPYPIQLMIMVDDVMFSEIESGRNGRSRTERLRELVEWGLMTENGE